MRYLSVLRIPGGMLFLGAASMLLPLGTALYYGQGDAAAFALAIGSALVFAVPMRFLPRRRHSMGAREGFLAVASSWIVLALMGALPYLFSGYIPSFTDALFESISGFTTTGATILRDVETLPRGLHLWRCFTQWMGGMGVLILSLALMPRMGLKSQHLMAAESPGPSTAKLVPKAGQTAKILYAIYVAMTAAQALILICLGMTPYDALLHAFATGGTGGFSMYADSVAHYDNAAIEAVIGVFMLLFGVNFSFYYLIIRRKWRALLKSEEVFVYLGIAAIATLAVAVNINAHAYGDAGEAARRAFFQVSSVMTSTGYSTTDYGAWPTFSRMLLMLLMLIGTCAGSTGGGIKVVRIIILVKTIIGSLRSIVHPGAVNVIKADGKVLDARTVDQVTRFFGAYILLALLGTLVVSLDNHGFTTTLTAVLASISNLGPGLEMVGPTGSYAIFSDPSKLTLAALMLLGRLEIFPILVLLSPSTWRHV